MWWSWAYMPMEIFPEGGHPLRFLPGGGLSFQFQGGVGGGQYFFSIAYRETFPGAKKFADFLYGIVKTISTRGQGLHVVSPVRQNNFLSIFLRRVKPIAACRRWNWILKTLAMYVGLMLFQGQSKWWPTKGKRHFQTFCKVQQSSLNKKCRSNAFYLQPSAGELI